MHTLKLNASTGMYEHSATLLSDENLLSLDGNRSVRTNSVSHEHKSKTKLPFNIHVTFKKYKILVLNMVTKSSFFEK